MREKIVKVLRHAYARGARVGYVLEIAQRLAVRNHIDVTDKDAFAAWVKANDVMKLAAEVLRKQTLRQVLRYYKDLPSKNRNRFVKVFRAQAAEKA
jgi:hypothetical protein